MKNSAGNTKQLPPKHSETLLSALKTRFDKNLNRRKPDANPLEFEGIRLSSRRCIAKLKP